MIGFPCFPDITILPEKFFTFGNKEYSVTISVYLHTDSSLIQYNPKQFVIIIKSAHCNLRKTDVNQVSP